MKKYLMALALIVAVLGAGQMAFAVPATLTVTADNLYYAINVVDANGFTTALTPLGVNSNDWTKADVYNFDLELYKTSRIDFVVANVGTGGSGNPAALLAQLDVEDCEGFLETKTKTILSSTEDYWSIVPNGFGPILTPTSYGNNSTSNIWYNNNGGPVAGIDGAAEWIWTDANFSSTGDQLAIVSLKATPAVPEPMTMLLFGPALLGLVGLKKKRA